MKVWWLVTNEIPHPFPEQQNTNSYLLATGEEQMFTDFNFPHQPLLVVFCCLCYFISEKTYATAQIHSISPAHAIMSGLQIAPPKGGWQSSPGDKYSFSHVPQAAQRDTGKHCLFGTSSSREEELKNFLFPYMKNLHLKSSCHFSEAKAVISGLFKGSDGHWG